MRRLEIPLLHDNHTHTSLYASLRTVPDISPLDGKSALGLLESLPRDRMTVVKGWRTQSLDISGDILKSLPPVLVLNFSLHGFAVSDAALSFLGDAFPGLGEHRFDPAWAEANLPELFSFYGTLSGVTPGKLSAFLDGLVPLGFGSAEDMTVTGVEAATAIAEAGFGERIPFWASPLVAESLGPGRRNYCIGTKFFLDGSLGARTAALSGGFKGPWKPVITYGDDAILTLAHNAASFGALSFHAIGDLAIAQAIRVSASLRGTGWDGAIRLEHAQFVDEHHGRLCRDNGIALSMQPNFSPDSLDYADRLVPELRAANNPFRMLIDRLGFVPGKDLFFGSDGMPHGVQSAFEASLFPGNPGQRLTLDELVSGYGTARGASGTTVIEIDDDKKTVMVIN